MSTVHHDPPARRQREIAEDRRFALRALKAYRRGQALSPRELAGLTRTYLRACDVWLYAIQAGEGGPVKLGKTVDPAARLLTLQTANAAPLRGLAAWRGTDVEEKLLHKEFADVRLHGEWFKPVAELLEYVRFHGGLFCDWERER